MAWITRKYRFLTRIYTEFSGANRFYYLLRRKYLAQPMRAVELAFTNSQVLKLRVLPWLGTDQPD